MKRFIFVSLVLGAFLSVAVPSAFAIGNGDIAIAPTSASDPADSRTQSWFIYNFLPGTTHKDNVSIRNESNEVRTVKLYAVDGYTTAQGGFALRSDTDPKETVGKWLTLEKSSLTLQPGEESIVGFQYVVPSTLEPGEYAGGIVAQDALQIQGQGIAVVKRVGVRLYHTVPGDRNERVSLVSSEMKMSETGRWFETTIENTGNVSLTLKLTETITHRDGSSVAVVESEPQTILPKSRVTLKTSEWKHPLIGSFVVNGVIEKDGKAMTDVPPYEFMIVSPLVIVAVVFCFVVVAIFIFLISRKKNKKSKSKRKK